MDLRFFFYNWCSFYGLDQNIQIILTPASPRSCTSIQFCNNNCNVIQIYVLQSSVPSLHILGITHDPSRNSKWPLSHREFGTFWQISPHFHRKSGKIDPSKTFYFYDLRTFFVSHPYSLGIKDFFFLEIHPFSTRFKFLGQSCWKKHPYFYNLRQFYPRKFWGHLRGHLYPFWNHHAYTMTA